MPFVAPTHEAQAIRRRRILISGITGEGKTSSLLTCPKPLGIVSAPGEKGYDTIPLDDPSIISRIYLTDDAKKVPSHQVVKEFEGLCFDMLAGKLGQLTTFAIDGLHKYVSYVMDMVTGGAYFQGDEFEPRLYGPAYKHVTDFMHRVMSTTLPVVAFTVWAELEADRRAKPGEKQSDIPSYIYPALPGRLAKEVMGEFSVVVHQSWRKERPTDASKRPMWQTRPGGDVKGCGLKGPMNIVSRIPVYLPADYTAFEAAWDAAIQANLKGENA